MNNFYKEMSSDLYGVYRNYCEKNGEHCRNSFDFKQGLISAGFEIKRTKWGMHVLGLRVVNNPGEFFQIS